MDCVSGTPVHSAVATWRLHHQTKALFETSFLLISSMKSNLPSSVRPRVSRVGWVVFSSLFTHTYDMRHVAPWGDYLRCHGCAYLSCLNATALSLSNTHTHTHTHRYAETSDNNMNNVYKTSAMCCAIVHTFFPSTCKKATFVTTPHLFFFLDLNPFWVDVIMVTSIARGCSVKQSVKQFFLCPAVTWLVRLQAMITFIITESVDHLLDLLSKVKSKETRKYLHWRSWQWRFFSEIMTQSQ